MGLLTVELTGDKETDINIVVLRDGWMWWYREYRRQQR